MGDIRNPGRLFQDISRLDLAQGTGRKGEKTSRKLLLVVGPWLLALWASLSGDNERRQHAVRCMEVAW